MQKSKFVRLLALFLSIGVDTLEHLRKVEKIMRNDPLLKAYCESGA